MLSAVIQELVAWMETQSLNLPQIQFEESSQIWSGRDFLPIFKELGIALETQQIISVSIYWY